METRFLAELANDTFSDEHGAVGGLELTTTLACMDSYKQFNCRYNFPSCDPETGEVFPVCITDCVDSFANCGNDEFDCTNERKYKNISLDEEAPSC